MEPISSQLNVVFGTNSGNRPTSHEKPVARLKV